MNMTYRYSQIIGLLAVLANPVWAQHGDIEFSYAPGKINVAAPDPELGLVFEGDIPTKLLARKTAGFGSRT
jgi:hypothetical protein